MVFIFKASMVQAPNLDKYVGYELVRVNDGNVTKNTTQDAPTQLNALQQMLPGVQREADLIVKVNVDGKEYYGRIAEIKPTSDLLIVSIEMLDENFQRTGKISLLGFEVIRVQNKDGTSYSKLGEVYKADKGTDFDGIEKFNKVKNCTLNLIAVKKKNDFQEWSGTPNGIYIEKMQAIASKVQSGLVWDKLLGKKIEISRDDPDNPLMKDTREFTIRGPCWTDGVALVYNTVTKELEVFDFNAEGVKVEVEPK